MGEAKADALSNKVKSSKTKVLVVSGQKNMLEKRMALVSELWAQDIEAEIIYKSNPKLLNQFQYCEENSIPLCAFFGDEELNRGVVSLRDMNTREQSEVKREE